MFGIPKDRLARGLEALNAHHCGYTRPGAGVAEVRCDCKYGLADTGRPGAEQNGCPELRMAARLINALSPAEFARVCKRAQVVVDRDDKPKRRKPTTPTEGK